jgi:hypothetical protein
LFGGALGFDALLPIVDLNAAFAPTSPAKLIANQGVTLGDLNGGAISADAAGYRAWAPRRRSSGRKLTVDLGSPSFRAAAMKLPASTTFVKIINSSRLIRLSN